MESFLQWLMALPAPVLYVLLGTAAAVENIVPPVPADTIVLFGGFLAGRGAAHPFGIFLAVWACNVLGAMSIWAIGRRYGTGFFDGRLGTMILKPWQLTRVSAFYARFGAGALFASRFMPVFRAVVPVFAGVARVSAFRALAPIAVASGIWYGALVYLGSTTGRNWEAIATALAHGGRWLVLAAVVVAVLVGRWWWHTRRPPSFR